MPVPIVLRRAYGTIGVMAEHRVRLDEEDVQLILSALAARRAMTEGLRRHRVDRLLVRLREMLPGNPQWRLDEYGQAHEDELAAAEAPHTSL